MPLSRAEFLTAAGGVAVAAAAPRRSSAATLDTISLDYAYYNPPSLILKQNGWLEAALAKTGTKVNWVLSLGSNKANSFLAANAIQSARLPAAQHCSRGPTAIRFGPCFCSRGLSGRRS